MTHTRSATVAVAKDADKGTLEFALRPYALKRSEVLERHPSIVPLVARILGVMPRAFGYLEIWPPAFETYSLVVPAFFDIPGCDAGLGIGPATRSLVAYASSRAHGCMYCAAHTAALGTVFRGAQTHLAQNQAAIDSGVCMLPSERDRALVDYGLQVARVPGKLGDDVLEQLAHHFSPPKVEKIVLVAVTMGLLNRCMDSLGMVLEAPLLETASRVLTKTGWDERAVYDGRYDAELLESDRTDNPLKPLGPLRLGRRMLGALRFESKALAKHPTRARSLDAHLEQTLGFVPAYFRHFRGSRIRRTLSHLLVERIAQTPGSLPPELCSAMCMVAAQVSQNQLLRAHFAAIGVRVSSVKSLTKLLTDTGSDRRHLLALKFAESASMVPHRIDRKLVSELTATFSPQEIIELVLTVSIYSALHRLTLSYPQSHWEPEVEALVREHGAELSLEPLKRR